MIIYSYGITIYSIPSFKILEYQLVWFKLKTIMIIYADNNNIHLCILAAASGGISFSPKMPLVVSGWQSVSYQGELLPIIILIGGTFELQTLMIVLLSPSEHI